ncbi:hydroxymethylpyrimidine/phosphomethylpyrimidine kinase [Gilvimarinus sp. DA14]|uniref:bifunctional hydroxymethylpyrimidine kinase/phosphomethylpyrimidine kinase n=1 Tax=Gilvimarinus sp. DA14 TaxID=2956798 RepID=UPI0020B63CBD|nr:hydroxymethylpyrimidine/phosphomethylpyrimidine kinase [Gilvimarinus sp. DA14]UTF59395.1 hydroxymethylpyrimidine/phosphomethylpyrimidine kinase [Gilvimarinus sp. DA14]
MSEFSSTSPVMISLSSHDPTGSTGVQADIETSFSLGVHCCPIVTALCARDTRQLIELQPTDASLLIEQTRAILEDMPVAAIKLGYFCQTEQIEAMHSILQDYPQIPVVLDPVLSLSINTPDAITPEAGNKLSDALLHLLLPLASITTPDIVEAQQLARQADSVDACARELLTHNCEAVLITGAKRTSEHFINCFYRPRQPAREFCWPRLAQFSHGSGATLSASLCAYLAHGLLLSDAVEQAQQFTWSSLKASRRLGMGHSIPNRLFWCKHNR